MSTEIRTLFGRFPTGVAIVSAIAPSSERLGVTISSFNSVSLDPQMVVFSLTKSLHSTPGFSHSEEYGLSFLAENQQDLAWKFARSGADKWTDTSLLEANQDQAPLLAGATAHLRLRRHQVVDAGDHLMFLCLVESFQFGKENAPLVFCQGKFRQLAT